MPDSLKDVDSCCVEVIDEDQLKYSRIKKKGYVRLVTNLGQLNIELHCDAVPKTCENFLVHCQKGYYNRTKFHRSIKNFMVRLLCRQPATPASWSCSNVLCAFHLSMTSPVQVHSVISDFVEFINSI